ncbi:MAG: sugar ABC transporter permease [Actinobacteria bacterium]|nr:sugar ABC transporter permease [Actinomycetota bacterium]
MSSDDVARRDRDSERTPMQAYIERLKSGELGALPVILGLVVIWAVFYIQNDRFLSAFNLTNLSLQIAGVGIISIGVVWVLLLGEIDLAVGSISGLAAAVAVVANLDNGVPGWLTIVIGLAVGAAIGLLQGLIITVFRVPSFIVTLAGLIGWQGVLLYTLGEGGTRNVTDRAMLSLTDTFLSPTVAWPLAIVLLGALIGNDHWQRMKRNKMGLVEGPIIGMLVREVVIVVGVVTAIIVFSNDRDFPLAVLIFIALVAICDLVARRTAFGRHVFAVGGNPEAARRAGINVTRIRLVVFTLSGLFAAAGGIMLASRLLAANQSSGGGNLLLTAIAGAVIGGVSLFGGRGTMYAALLGALVIGSVSNGIALVGLTSDLEFMITAAVLLAAVIVDATARRGRQSAGR